ncbi:unnamed protein product [Moneuplotes crassus]|uniref:Uncharacterized protein n=1 Tax=Euplotes crassus TaxID=5936 RepID=A0AAD1XKA9_EUPCR|nr:unnamed protein product [Moneuplotes crassus]
MLKNPDEIRYTMLDKAANDIYEWNKDRKDYVKEQFKNILDGMASFNSKCFCVIYNTIPSRKYNSYLRSKKRKHKYIQKECESVQDIFFQYDFSEELTKIMLKCSKVASKGLKELSKIARELVVLRNRLLNAYNVMEEYFDANQEMWIKYDKEDVVKFIKIFSEMKIRKMVTNHSAWQIPKKNHTSENYEEGEMTEEEL